MNIINKLTLRHLKENKRRTAVTIIGVIISVAMVTAVATLGVSFLDLMKRETIADNGEWHVQYKDVNLEQLNAIENDEQTENLMIANDRGYAYLPESENDNKPYLFIKEYNNSGLEGFPIELSEGRFPNGKNEVIISEHIMNNGKVEYAIGDELTLGIGSRVSEVNNSPLTQNFSLQRDENGIIESLQLETEETFTVVGIMERPTWEPTWAPGYTIIRYVDESLLTNEDTVDAVVTVKKVNGKLFEHAEKLAEENHIDAVNFNSELLRYYGVTDNDNLRMTMFSLAGIIMAVIIIGSVALIYNAFAISVSERARHLGMLSSVGATKKQKRNSVFFEGAVIGAISIPIGIISGIFGIWVTFKFINTFLEGAIGTTEKLGVIVTPGSISVACVVSIVTIFISTYLPARKASKVSAIDAIRQTQDVKLSGKTVKTSKLIRKIFGMEAEIGLKNLKRNKKRYQATVFSLVISIVLFLSVSFFTSNLEKSIELSQNNINYDILVSGGMSVDTAELVPLASLDYVTDSTIVEEIYLDTWIDESEIAEGLREFVREDKSILENGKFRYNLVLHGLDEQSFQNYAEQIGADGEELNNSNHPKAIVIEQISYQDYETGKFVETKSINTELGKTIELYKTNYETNEKELINDVEIAALTNQVPMGVDTAGLGGVDVIVSQATLHQLINEQVGMELRAYLYMKSSDPMATQEVIDEVKEGNMHVYNTYQSRQQGEQMILLMSVFTYGFIALISLISIANIFNTISTSIALRKREFAMLKSVGMTPKGFNKMINYESLFYGVKALIYGLPISTFVMFLIYRSLGNTFEYGFSLPWMSIIYVIAAIFIIVSAAMLYSIQKIKKENIIEGLKQEII